MPETMGVAQRTPVLGGPIVSPNGLVSIEPLNPSARFCLRIDPAAATDLNEVAGFLIGIPINRGTVMGDRTAMRLGPDEWILLAPEDDAATIEREIKSALATHIFSLADIGHRDVPVAVSGKHAAEVINGACPLDLDDAAFPPGSASRTLLGKAEIVLLRASADAYYRVESARSFAEYVQSLLKELAREFLQELDESSTSG
jgi:sarcosine oxidase, subunit gamma